MSIDNLLEEYLRTKDPNWISAKPRKIKKSRSNYLNNLLNFKNQY